MGLHIFLHQPHALHGNLLDLLPFLVEHHVSLQRGGRVIDVDNGLLHALNRLEGAADQVFSALCQHLDCHIVRNHPALYQLS